MNFVSKPESGEIPFEITQPDRIPAKRYYDKEFYDLENEKLWPHVWQMACRLEEIPNPGDYSVYRILDKSVIVIRTDSSKIKAYHNHCRHRGVELVQTQGHTSGGFVCPFHGWRWDANGNNTFVYAEQAFSEANLCKDDLNLVSIRVDTWGGSAFINFDNNAPPLRESLGSFATRMDAWGVEDLKVDWWMSTRLPCNWKLAMEAFMEGYHVATTHPQLLPPGVTSRPGDAIWVKVPEEHATVSLWMTTASKQMPTEMDAQEFIELNIKYMDLLSDGMAGMTHKQEVAVARKMVGLELPKDPRVAAGVWRKALHNAVMEYYRGIGAPTPDLNEVDRKGYAVGVNFCFPHYFLLPTFGSASSYRIRPLGPEECLFELWSLTRFPANEKRPRPQPPAPKPHDDQDWPPIPRQDFSNLPKQQRGLHAGLEFMRLSHEMEGLISNYQRTIDAYLRGASNDRLLAALQEASGPIDVPVADLGLQVDTPVS